MTASLVSGHLHLLRLFFRVTITSIYCSRCASTPAVARLGSMLMNTSLNDPGSDNVLPAFYFLGGADEGDVGIAMKPNMLPNPGVDLFRDGVPDYVLNNTMSDLRDHTLPWLRKDGWTTDRPSKEVPMVVLENDVLKVFIEPLWGGKVRRVLHKPTGKDLVYFHREHQSVNDGIVRCRGLSGIQWNWLVSELGHTVFDENPVYAAIVPTENGDAVRIYEFDRRNGTSWQVDLHLDGDVLWAHITVHNPTPLPLPGYWWTNVQMPYSSPTSKISEAGGIPCVPQNASLPGSRVLSPAWGALTADDGGMSMVEWPRWNQKSGNYLQNMPGSFGVGGVDMSYLSNFTENFDSFLQCIGYNSTASNYIALVDETLWGEDVGVIHGHSTPFNKVWMWGQDQIRAWTQSENVWGGCFVELQIGVAPSQMHTFPLPARSKHEHVEFWKLMDGFDDAGDGSGGSESDGDGSSSSAGGESLPSDLKRASLYSQNYTEAITSVNRYFNDRVPRARFENMKMFMADVAARPLRAQQVVFNGSAWGAIHQKLGAEPPLPASMVFFDKPENSHFSAYADNDVSPWRELLEVGTFSNASLNLPPTSFIAGGSIKWAVALEQSATSHGWTWLHHLHLGVFAAEQLDLASAKRHFNASVALRPNGHSLRCLATMSEDFAEKWALYTRAWEAAVGDHLAATQQLAGNERSRRPSATARLMCNLAGEMAYVLRKSSQWKMLEQQLPVWSVFAWSKTNTATGGEISLGRAMVALHVHDDCNSALVEMGGHSYAHWDYEGRPMLVSMWFAALVRCEEKKYSRKLTLLERKHLKYKQLPPPGVGAINVPEFIGPKGVTWP